MSEMTFREMRLALHRIDGELKDIHRQLEARVAPGSFLWRKESERRVAWIDANFPRSPWTHASSTPEPFDNDVGKWAKAKNALSHARWWCGDASRRVQSIEEVLARYDPEPEPLKRLRRRTRRKRR
jgi:hypothetical protein